MVKEINQITPENNEGEESMDTRINPIRRRIIEAAKADLKSSEQPYTREDLLTALLVRWFSTGLNTPTDTEVSQVRGLFESDLEKLDKAEKGTSPAGSSKPHQERVGWWEKREEEL